MLLNERTYVKNENVNIPTVRHVPRPNQDWVTKDTVLFCQFIRT